MSAIDKRFVHRALCQLDLLGRLSTNWTSTRDHMHWGQRLRNCAAVMGASLCLAPAGVSAQASTVQPQGPFAQIDTRLANETIELLDKGNAGEQQRTIERIKARPENFAPPVLYALANALFQRGEKDDAAFWFYAGQLRARFDANRCADVTARQAVRELNRTFGVAINKYAFEDLPKLEALIPRVVEWDRRTPHRYDHRWINLHGMEAMRSALGGKSGAPTALSAPEEEWEKMAEKTREDYMGAFEKAVARMKSRQK
jgi:hypothetical protein